MEKVGVIVVNYNNWFDTIECLESILKNEYDEIEIIIVDNGSKDNSVDMIKKWAKGELEIFNLFDDYGRKNLLLNLTFPNIEKPLSYKLYRCVLDDYVEMESFCARTKFCLEIVKNDVNLGYAAGANIGLNLALNNGCEYFVVLNNDVVLDRRFIKNMVSCYKYYKAKGMKVGVIGSKCLNFYMPEHINNLGSWLALCFGFKPIAEAELDRGQYDSYNLFLKKDYIPYGAAMFVSKEFLLDVGLMGEEYFLYREEIDWLLRSIAKGYVGAYCYKAKAYHKISKSTKRDKESYVFSDYYELRSRVLVARKFKKYKCLIWIAFAYLIEAVKRVVFYDSRKPPINVFKAFFDGLRYNFSGNSGN